MTSIIYPKHHSSRKSPANYSGDDLELFKDDFYREIEKSQIVHLHNVFILEDIVANIYNIRKYLPFCQVGNLSVKSLIRRISHFISGFSIIDNGIWIVDNWSIAYFHWFTEALPRLLLADKIELNYPIILPEIFKNYPFVQESLSLISKREIVFSSKKPIMVRTLNLTSHTAFRGNYNETLIGELRFRFASNYSKVLPFKKVYISRQKAGKRKVLNENVIIETLLKYEFEIHHFEDYSLEKQISLMSKTKFLIGLHGAGLTNMLFMPKGGSIFELRNGSDVTNNCYYNLACALEHSYFYQLNAGRKRDRRLLDVKVDINEFKANLELIIGSC